MSKASLFSFVGACFLLLSNFAFAQEVSNFLPQNTFFLASFPNPAEASTKLKNLPVAKLFEDPNVQKLLGITTKEVMREFRLKSLDESFLEKYYKFPEMLDRGLSIAFLKNQEKPGKEPEIVMIAQTSTKEKMDGYVEYLSGWLLGDLRKNLIAHKMENIVVYEVPSHNYLNLFTSQVGANFIVGIEKEVVARVAKNFTAEKKNQNALSEDPSYLQSRKSTKKENELFYVYFDLNKMIPSSNGKNFSALKIKANETSAIGSLRSLSTSQNQFQNSCVKDRDLDGVGEYGYFTELSGTLNVPVGKSEGVPVRPTFLTSVFGATSVQNGGIATKSGYHFLMYLPGENEAIRENGNAVLPNENARNEINAQETRWICYAWPVKKGETGNRCFVVNQGGEVLASNNATYSGVISIPDVEACFNNDANSKSATSKEQAKNLDGEIAFNRASFDGFTWVSEFDNYRDSYQQRTIYQEIEEGLKTSEMQFFGFHKLKGLSVSLQIKDENIEDSISFQFKEGHKGILSSLKGKANSFSSAELCPKDSVFFGSLKLSVNKIAEMLIKEMDRGRGFENNTSGTLSAFKNSFKFSLMEDFLNLLGDEISLYVSLPEFGILPKAALMLPLNNPEKFFKNIEILLSAQDDFSFHNTDYYGHRIYYLKPKSRYSWDWSTWFFKPTFTYIGNHFVVSYNPAAIKDIVRLKQQEEDSLADSDAWMNCFQKAPGPHQGIAYFNGKEIIQSIYEIVYQILLIIPENPPFDVALLPAPEDVAVYFGTTSSFIDYKPNSIQIHSSGNAFTPGFGLLEAFDTACFMIVTEVFKSKTSPESRTSVIGSLRTISTSQNQFQNSCVKDRDLDGVGEYGYFTELSGTLNVPVGESEGIPVRPAFLASVFGATSLQNRGIATKSGYHFLMYLSGENEAIRENGNVVLPNENARNEINEQETRWVCYAWPVRNGGTGNSCFAINQAGEVLVSNNATYNGLDSIPSPNAIFEKGSKNIAGSIVTGAPAFDGFTWNPVD